MADSRKKGGKRSDKRGSRCKGEAASNTEADLLLALDHELRRRILRLLNASVKPHSPVMVAKTIDEVLSNVSYHFKILRRQGAIALFKTRQVRGATEHLYVSKVSDNLAVLELLAATQEHDEESTSNVRNP